MLVRTMSYLLFGNTPCGYTATRPPFQTFVKAYDSYRSLADEIDDLGKRRGDITHYIVYSRGFYSNDDVRSDCPLFSNMWTFQEIITVRLRTTVSIVMGTPPERCYSNDMETFFFN